MDNKPVVLSSEENLTNTVKTPIKRPFYFHFLDEMSLNCEMSLDYKNSNFNTF